METCPTCKRPLEAGQTIEAPAGRVNVPVDQAWFDNVCRLMLASPTCTDHRFRVALEDLPKSLKNYGSLTEGQWKFFAVIHNKVLGTWPERGQKLEAVHKAATLTDEDLASTF